MPADVALLSICEFFRCPPDVALRQDPALVWRLMEIPAVREVAGEGAMRDLSPEGRDLFYEIRAALGARDGAAWISKKISFDRVEAR